MSPREIRHPTIVAVGVSVAVLAYAASLAVQRVVPALGQALVVNVDGVRPTYYLRVIASLGAGAVAGLLARKLKVPERRLAWGMVIAVAISLSLVWLVP